VRERLRARARRRAPLQTGVLSAAAWRQNDANFEVCVASVKKVEAERKRSVPDLLYTPHDLKCGKNLDRYLCAMGNSWACK
jgi:hypothetical protein